MYYNFHGEGGRFLASSYYIDHKGVYFKGCGLFEWIRLWSQISVSLLHSLYQVKNFCNVALAFVILILNIFGYAHDGNIPRLQTIVYLGTPVGPSPSRAFLLTFVHLCVQIYMAGEGVSQGPLSTSASQFLKRSLVFVSAANLGSGRTFLFPGK